jgi:hypothetical protein
MAHRLLGQEHSTSSPRWLNIRPSLNDDPSLCDTLYTAVGVGELYQRQFLTTPSAFETSENGR